MLRRSRRRPFSRDAGALHTDVDAPDFELPDDTSETGRSFGAERKKRALFPEARVW